MMKKIFTTVLFALTISLLFTGCFSEKGSPFYDSEWIMTNYDENNQLYYHHLILSPDHKVMLRVSYADSTNIIVWSGTYKVNSKKFDFDFKECIRYENGEPVGKYVTGKMIKYYTGDYLYSLGKSDDNSEEDAKYVLRLIRPKNYFYGEGLDIFGNMLEDFVKTK